MPVKNNNKRAVFKSQLETQKPNHCAVIKSQCLPCKEELSYLLWQTETRQVLTLNVRSC